MTPPPLTRQEFLQARELQTALWPHSRKPPAPEHVEVIYNLWQGLAYPELVAALQALAAEGREHAPPPGVVVAKVAAMRGHGASGRAAFDAVWQCLEHANRLGAFRHVLAPVPADAAARERLAAAHPPDVIAFAARHYRDYAMAGGADGDPVGVVRAQLRALWEQAGARAQDDAARGLAGVTALPRLRRVDAPQIGGAA